MGAECGGEVGAVFLVWGDGRPQVGLEGENAGESTGGFAWVWLVTR